MSSTFALRATVDILRVMVSSLGLPSEARPKGERRMVDLTSTGSNRLIVWIRHLAALRDRWREGQNGYCA
ncbi:MAG: hypothetical protein KGN76_00665 [Acidobacteriota bacterium]|nr:hypothetical protein [Acidobacteriota bacterium]